MLNHSDQTMKVEVIEAKNEELEEDFCAADDVALIHPNIVHLQCPFYRDNNSILERKGEIDWET